MDDSNGERLTPVLDRAASLLRDEPAVRPEWRDALLARVTRESGPRALSPAKRWSIRPMMAIAAGLVCAMIGGGVTFAVTKSGQTLRTGGDMASASKSAMTPVSSPGASRVRFSLVAPKAAHVSIVGDFNQWNPTALPLRRLPDGQTWEVEVPLAPGRYTYAFFVDGRVARDTAAAESANDGFGITNSVVLVKGT